jgi:hypothetical protein
VAEIYGLDTVGRVVRWASHRVGLEQLGARYVTRTDILAWGLQLVRLVDVQIR